MPSALVVMGAYTIDADALMSPPGGIVGGSGSVDDGSDSTYVVVRMQRSVPNTSLRGTFYTWSPAPVDLPEYDDVVFPPRVDIRVRTELLQTFAYNSPPFNVLTVYQTGPLASFFGVTYTVDYGAAWRTASFTLTEDRWNEFRGGLLTIGAINNRVSPNPLAAPGEEEQFAVYEIEYTIVWTLKRPHRPIQRIHPRGDGARIFPAQATNRIAGGYV